MTSTTMEDNNRVHSSMDERLEVMLNRGLFDSRNHVDSVDSNKAIKSFEYYENKKVKKKRTKNQQTDKTKEEKRSGREIQVNRILSKSFDHAQESQQPILDISFSPTDELYMENQEQDQDIVVPPNPRSSVERQSSAKNKLSLSFASPSFPSLPSQISKSNSIINDAGGQEQSSWTIPLPGSTVLKISVLELMKQLVLPGNLSAQDHHKYIVSVSGGKNKPKNKDRNDAYYLFCKGSHVLKTLQEGKLFQMLTQDQSHSVSPAQMEIWAGTVLLQTGILHAYTNMTVTRFRDALVVLAPFRDPTILNNFVPWRQDTKQQQDPMDVILLLSRQMDELCACWLLDDNQDCAIVNGTDIRDTSQHSPRPHVQEMLEQFQFSCCQLQVTPFPADSAVERVTFALNLYNIIIRHAMLLYRQNKLNHVKWPKSLHELQPFLQKVGYTVGGDFYSLADLQHSLYGYQTVKDQPKLETRSFNGAWQRLFCKSANDIGPMETFYRKAAIRNDPRLLFATTWGCVSSPTVATAYPNRLQECLQTAAEAYCRQHVQVIVHEGTTADGSRLPPTVILPTLLSWHRRDFASSPNKPLLVLYEILPYLSKEQLRAMEGARQKSGRLQVQFAPEHEFQWGCGMNVEANVASSSPETSLLRQESLVSDMYTTVTECPPKHDHLHQPLTPQRQKYGTPSTARSSFFGDECNLSPIRPPLGRLSSKTMGGGNSIGPDAPLSPPKRHSAAGNNSAYNDDPYFDEDGADYEPEGMYQDDEGTFFRSDVSAITMESIDLDQLKGFSNRLKVSRK